MYSKLLISAGGGIISRDQQAEQDNCATIAIGLGGTGIACLRTLKKEVFTRVKTDDPTSPVAKYKHIKYLAVDTDKSSLADNGSIDTLDANTEFFNISCPDINGLLNQTHIIAQDPSLNWLKTRNSEGDGGGISILQAQAGAGGVRQIGRLLLLQNVRSFVSKLTNIITEAKSDLTGDFSINIHIFTGISGGTGAGTFLDVCYIVQYVLGQMGLAGQAYTCGYLFLPDVNIANKNLDYLPINGFAAMKELDYCMNYHNNGGEWNQQYDGFSIRTSEPPVKLAHLISATDSSGATPSNAYNHAIHVVADYVLEYIIKPYIDENDTNTGEGVFTIKSHTANVNTHIDLVDKRHGATYNYCILGASNAYLPYKEITTYLTSKIFEGFSNLPKQIPLDNDIDMFIKTNSLEYVDIYRELCNNLPNVPNIPVDHNILFEQTQGLEHGVFPHILEPMRAAGERIAGQLQTNKEALLNSRSDISIEGNGSILALAERIRSKLFDIAKQADKGPYYSSAMLHNIKARDLRKIIVGYKTTNEESMKNALGDLKLRDESLENSLKMLQNSNRFNRRSKAEEYSNSLRAYFMKKNEINSLQVMNELLTELEKQLTDLYNEYFSIFATVMHNIQATFAANMETLSKPLVEDNSYAIKIMTIQDLKESLDDTVKSMDIPGQIHGFITHMLNKPETWISQDENRIALEVTDYFLSQLGDYTSRTIDDYLKIKYGTIVPEILQRKVYEDIITNQISIRAKPKFWTEQSIYKLASSSSMGYLSIPNISSVVQAAAQQFKIANNDISVRTAWAKDRITMYQFICGVPLFGYKGVWNYKDSYKQKKIVGSHLYEDSVRDKRDSRKLINISPISTIPEDQYTPDDRLNIDMYNFAIEKGIIEKVAIGDGYEYHLNIFNDEEIIKCTEIAQKIIDTKDEQKAIAFINSCEGKKFEIKSYRVIPNNQNNDYANIIIKDHILGSMLLVGILSEQVSLLKQYSDNVLLLKEMIESVGKSKNNVHNFAMAMMTSAIKKLNDYQYSYVYSTFGFEESINLTTIDSKPFGLVLPLYSAFKGYCELNNEYKNQIDELVRELLVSNKELVDSTILEVKETIKPERLNATLSTARNNFIADFEEISSFMKQFVIEVTNFAATR